MLADELDYVIGVDTHRDEHVLAVVVAPTGAVVAQRSVQSSARGYAAAARFAEEHANGARVWAVEGAGHYGAGLARYLSGRGETVLEVGRGPRAERRLGGKDDSLDAIRAARTALASKTLAMPRAGERREALQLLLLARRSAVDVRREALVQLRSVIVTAPDRLREQLRGLPVQRLVERCSRLRRSSSAPPDELATRQVLRSLARRIEAAPIPASSGQTTRHRLSRGGDRQLNRALHTVILHRRLHDPATQAYIARRVAEGKSRRDAVRLLKRYLARHLYRILDNQTPLTT